MSVRVATRNLPERCVIESVNFKYTTYIIVHLYFSGQSERTSQDARAPGSGTGV